MQPRSMLPLLQSVQVALIASPLWYPIAVSIVFNVPHHHIDVFVQPFFLLTVTLAVLTGFGLRFMKRWSWHSLCALQVSFFYTHLCLMTQYSDSHHKLVSFCMAVALQTLFFERFLHVFRVPYFFPKTFWWEMQPRPELGTCEIAINDRFFSASIIDIASVGCFVKTKETFQLGQSVVLNGDILGMTFKVPGTIVWCAGNSVTYPRGIGIRFVRSAAQRRRLKQVTNLVRSIRKILAVRSSLPEAEFHARLQALRS